MPALFIALFFAFSFCALMGCSQKAVQDEPIITANPAPKQPVNPVLVPEKPVEPPAELKAIYFEYDRAEIRPDALQTLDQTARWLKDHPDIKIQIEGHCDERGSREYNLRLGEQRAEGARDVLVSKGVDSTRITTVSYGAHGNQSEKTWSLHRKAEFVLIFPNQSSEKKD